jgi:hypothetical protein
MGAGELKERTWQQECDAHLEEEAAEHRLLVASTLGSTVISVAAGGAAIGGLLGVGGALAGALAGGTVVALGFAARSMRHGNSHHFPESR